MGHPYSVQPIIGGSGITNGSLVVLTFETGLYTRLEPEVNSFVSSGTMNVRTSGRFDEHYGGGPS